MPETGRTKFPIDELALKMAFIAAALMATLVAVGYLVREVISFQLLILLSIPAMGLASYFAARFFLTSRIELAHSTLRRIRKRNFEGIDSTKPPHGDALDELVRQVYRIGHTMQTEINRLKQLENYRREFLGDVSHELKTPIFAVQGFAETLLDGALEDESVNHAFVEKILRNAERLNNLVEDLAAISMIETGELKMNIHSFELKLLVQEVADELEPLLERNEVQLFIFIPENLSLVKADRDRIRQVLANLLTNAIKYNRSGGRIEVTARRVGTKDVYISVTDDGLGIAPAHLGRITERFYRVDKSRSRDQGGTGLGLAIVKHILEAHKSHLDVESTLGKGSTFSFLLPIQPITLSIEAVSMPPAGIN
ncbi:MAG: histidine kinase [Bacteroidetes Order II. Incertae sedis bacterium]|nr:histidine kinase [Bacteroidetes Order II. bacterium]